MYNTNSFSSTSFIDGFILANAFLFFIIAFLIVFADVIAKWFIFKKAKQPKWASLIPFYNSYILYKITWGYGALLLVPIIGAFATGIPYLGVIVSIALLVFNALTCYKLSEAFGNRVGFAIGLYFLPTLFMLILAFNKQEYLGVPKDGTSYKEIKDKADEYKAKKGPVEYEDPNKED